MMVKSSFKYMVLSLFANTILFFSCTNSFERFNTDQTGFPDDLQGYDYNKWGIQPGIIQRGIYFNYNWGDGVNWPFQIMQNLNVDMFAGYFHDFKGAFNSSNSVYKLNYGWNSSNWEYTYGYIMPAIYRSELLASDDGYSSFLGITKILKVAAMHRIADQYGPLVYSDFGSKTGSQPEPLKDAYINFFADLEEGISLVKSWVTENPGIEYFKKFDILTKTKSYDEWLRFANSLRLRLAIRISNVDKGMAAAEIKKCFDCNIGFLEKGTNIIAVSTRGTGYSNPLGEINKAWKDVFMNASMESYLVGYEDPRLPRYFDRALGDGEGNYLLNITDTYKGFRQGMGVEHDNYNGHSRSTITQTTDAILMTPAEVWFLRAEAALRGMSSDVVGECYVNGVRASCNQWGVGDEVDEYLQSDNAPKDYKDALDSIFDVKAMSTITPKWDDSASYEEKLERIITQKWIACYPEGAEAWAEQRRTGYPKLFKVYINNSEGRIDTDIMIRRLPYPARLSIDNPEQYQKLLQYLDGEDTGGTRLWWDVGENMF